MNNQIPLVNLTFKNILVSSTSADLICIKDTKLIILVELVLMYTTEYNLSTSNMANLTICKFKANLKTQSLHTLRIQYC